MVFLCIYLEADFLFGLLIMPHIFMFHYAFWLTCIVGIFSIYFSNLNFYEVPYYKKFRMVQQRDKEKVHCMLHREEFIFTMGVIHYKIS